MKGICPPVRCQLLILATLLITTTSHAETLQDAWLEALAVNHSIKAVQENTAAAEQQLKAAEASRLPAVSLQAGYTLLGEKPALIAALGATSMEIPMGDKNSLSYGLTTTLPIYTSGRISNGIGAASASIKASRANEQRNIQDLKLKIAEAFVGVLRATRGLEVASSHVNSLQAHTRDAQNMYDQGLATRNDLLTAQVSLADANQLMSQVENMLNIARASYNYLLGRPLSQNVVLNELPPNTFDEPLDELTKQAITQRSELMIMNHQIAALRHQASGVRAEDDVQIALTGGYGYQENQYQVYEGQWQVTVGAEWKLFDGGVINHRASAIDRKAKGIQEQHSDLVSAISLQVRQAWLAKQESHNRILVTEAAIDQANENLKVTRDHYETGTTNSTQVLDAEALRTRSQSNHANARYDAVLANLRLKRAVGYL